MEQKEYLGVKYTDIGNGKYRITWPSGLSSEVVCSSEEALKAAIQMLAAQL